MYKWHGRGLLSGTAKSRSGATPLPEKRLTPAERIRARSTRYSPTAIARSVLEGVTSAEACGWCRWKPRWASAQVQVDAIGEAGTAAQRSMTAAMGHRLLVLAAGLAAVLVLAAGALAAGSPATPSVANGEEDGPYTQREDPYLADGGAYNGP